MKYLLDTNICIYIMKNSYPQVTDRLLSISPDEIAVSSITLFELEYGAAKSRWSARTQEKLYAFLSPFAILSFDARDAACAGRLRALLTKSGSPIGPYDIQIASQALSRELTLVTHNTGEFSRVPGLALEDWSLLN